MRTFDIIPLQPDHVPAAAELFLARYRAARTREPLLPGQHDNIDAAVMRVQKLLRKTSGIAAIRGNDLVGFMIGQQIEFADRPAVYIPEWAHAAVDEDRPGVYRAMYAQLSGDWVNGGRLTHLVALFADDSAALAPFSWLRFGMACVDALRDLSPLHIQDDAEMRIRRGGAMDMDAITELLHVLEEHLSGAPIFRPRRAAPMREEVASDVEDVTGAFWVACCERRPVAFMRIRPANTGVAFTIQDAKTARIQVAYARPEYRARGVGTMLLGRCIDWARSAGFTRCAVDFEPQNIPGAPFWLKHFHPVCYSMLRRIDEQTLRVQKR